MRKLIVISTLAVLLAGCGQAAPAVEQASITPTQSVDAIADESSSPTIVPSPVILSTTTPASSPEGASVVNVERVTREALAAYLKVDADTLSLASVQPQQWSDGSLGCPDPSMGYTQAIVPGYLLVFSDGDKTYPIHTSESAHPLIFCREGKPTILSPIAYGEQAPETTSITLESPTGPDNTTPVATPPVQEEQTLLPTQSPDTPLSADMRQMLDRAIAHLASDLGVAENTISLVLSDSVIWNDGSLGCPQPGVEYIQVLIEGYRFVLESDGIQYELHTDTRSTVVRCPSVNPDMPSNTDRPREQ